MKILRGFPFEPSGIPPTLLYVEMEEQGAAQVRCQVSNDIKDQLP